jgi:hypothetical protein
MERYPVLRSGLLPARREQRALVQLRSAGHQAIARVEIEQQIASAKVLAVEDTGHDIITGLGRLGRHAAFEVEHTPFMVSHIVAVVDRIAYGMSNEIDRLSRNLR